MLPPTTVEAEPTVLCDPRDNTRCGASLKAGELAPFTGELLSPSLAAELAVKAKGCKERIKLEVAKTSSVVKEQCRADLQLVTKDVIDLEARNQELEEELKKSQPWFLHPLPVAVTSILATLGVVGIIVLTHPPSASR